MVPKGLNVRPTADRVKESIFSILGDVVEMARVLDLFAGTGALGLEALSRGAAFSLFVDRHPASLEAIGKNISLTGVAPQARVVRMDLSRAAPSRGKLDGPFDLVFMDPPYGKRLAEIVLERIHHAGILSPQARIVIEHEAQLRLSDLHPAWNIVTHRKYGQTAVTFLEFG